MPYHHGHLREALVERAAQVIAEGGVEALSLRGLARDLGVSHAAPRRHFADREALLSELAKAGFRRSVDAMNAGAEAAGADPVARYRALGRAYVEFARRDPAYFRAITHPEVRAIADAELQALQREWFATLRAGAAAAQRSGWHPEADPDVLIAFSVAAAMGAASLLSDADWCSLLGVDEPDALADDVLDLVVGRTRPGIVGDTPGRAPSGATPSGATGGGSLACGGPGDGASVACGEADVAADGMRSDRMRSDRSPNERRAS